MRNLFIIALTVLVSTVSLWGQKDGAFRKSTPLLMLTLVGYSNTLIKAALNLPRNLLMEGRFRIVPGKVRKKSRDLPH